MTTLGPKSCFENLRLTKRRRSFLRRLLVSSNLSCLKVLPFKTLRPRGIAENSEELYDVERPYYKHLYSVR
jgi:hypothetical protein